MQDVCSRRRSSLSPACWGPSDHSVGRVDRWEKGVVVAAAGPRCLSSNEVAIMFSRLADVFVSRLWCWTSLSLDGAAAYGTADFELHTASKACRLSRFVNRSKSNPAVPRKERRTNECTGNFGRQGETGKTEGQARTLVIRHRGMR